MVANLLVFLVLFRGDLIGGYDEDHFFEAENPAFFRLAAGGVAAILVAFFVAPVFGLSIGLMALLGAGSSSSWRGFSGGSRFGKFRVRSHGGLSRS